MEEGEKTTSKGGEQRTTDDYQETTPDTSQPTGGIRALSGAKQDAIRRFPTIEETRQLDDIEEEKAEEWQQLTPKSTTETIVFSTPASGEAAIQKEKQNVPYQRHPFRSPRTAAAEAETPIRSNLTSNVADNLSSSGTPIYKESAISESIADDLKLEILSQSSQMEDIPEHDDIELQDLSRDDLSTQDDLSKDNASGDGTIDNRAASPFPENGSEAPNGRPALIRTPSGKMIAGGSRRLSLTVDLETGKEGGTRGHCAVVSCLDAKLLKAIVLCMHVLKIQLFFFLKIRNPSQTTAQSSLKRRTHQLTKLISKGRNIVTFWDGKDNEEEEGESVEMKVSFHGRLKVQSSRVLVHDSDSDDSSKEQNEDRRVMKERIETQYRLQAIQVSRNCYGHIYGWSSYPDFLLTLCLSLFLVENWLNGALCCCKLLGGKAA